ncbi:hypothetical protein Nepgr_026984 [Nepenthes gracilis]|uniref:Protein kinase domain-containing protein n=1 Tax=Nepenthes gracilis TaxID=150966 RepID=A0AAD3Y336_NEPGR|nr:hypothetical protein Nepgr_026984 [Nepenthes gracilis]
MREMLTNTTKVVFSLFILSLLFVAVLSASDELRALLEFKKGIKDDPLGKVLESWNQTSVSVTDNHDACPSSFYGVICDESSGSVIAIVLERLELSGELKFFTLIGLRMLRNLSLAGNYFTGRLVPALGSMSSLQHLDLSDNGFYGSIPKRINDLYGLIYLNLSSNRFSGWYPSGISNLQQLRVLDFRSNELSGDAGIFFMELSNVEHVDLSWNMFSGALPTDPRNVSGLVNTVRHLDFSHNKLKGAFLSSDTIALFRNLQFLDLGNNVLTGELPSFGSWSNLNVLRLGNNQLYGEVPEELLTSSIRLEELDLSGNGFSGSVGSINSTTLKKLNLSRNMISDDVSIMMKWESPLEVLDLSSNRLTGSFPNLTSQLYGLTTLKMSNNSVEGNLPHALGTFSRLSTIDLSLNNFGGPIPPSLFTAGSLVNLNLSRNQITGQIPLQGSHASEFLVQSFYPSMEILDLSDNLLTGGLTSGIGNLGGLKLLNLAKNGLSGQIPSELGKLKGLEFLDLSNNNFTDHLPINLPSGLMVFNVSYNNLSGPIPKNLRKFPLSSFRPGNEFLQIPNGDESSSGTVTYISERGRHHTSKASIRVAIIVASVGAAVMIAFVLLAYYHAQLHAFHGRSKFSCDTTGRDVGIFTRPSLFKFHKGDDPPQSSLGFSNDHLLTSTSRSLSGQAELVTEIIENVSEGVLSTANLLDNPPVTSARKSSPDSSSPHLTERSEQPVTLDVYSPDRLSGQLYFLDSSLMFTAEELSRAPAEVLGRSSHGTLYKATLDSGQMLTVKWLRVGLVKHKKEFAREVKKISLMRHPNIVPVRAYYWGPKEQERLILSDYIQGDSLALHLYESTPRRHSLLSFDQRLTVAVDIARCLLFLHDRGMPHGNLKPTNVLLAGPDLSARLTDYALHRLMTPSGIAEQILNLGALGYCAPELAAAAKKIPSFKADVYAFGVILMELLTRRSAGDIMSGQSGAIDLPDWVRLCDREGRRRDCIDREMLDGEEPSKAMDDVLGISLRCILPVNERPNIRRVFEDLCSLSSAA